jgi:acyl-CoA thioesterase
MAERSCSWSIWVGGRRSGDDTSTARGWLQASTCHATSHHVETDDEWLLLHGSSNVAADGLIATQQSVWTERGRLLASGRSQLLSRRVPPPAL